MIDFSFGVNLQPLDTTHAALVRSWRNQYAIWQWCRQYDVISDWQQADWFKRQSEDKSIRMYLVCKLDEPVGVCGLTSIDLINRRGEFSLYVAPKFHGEGIGKRALQTLLAHGFRNLGLNVIWGETFDGNPAEKTFTKVGMTKEGTRREFYFRDGRFIDAHLYSMTRKDWDALPRGPRLCST